MGKKVLLSVILFSMIYPAFMLVHAVGSMVPAQADGAQEDISGFLLSVWIVWLISTGIAIYHKWSQKEDVFFYVTYVILVLGFSVYGYLVQDFVNTYGLDDGFRDDYTLGVLTALEQIAMAAVLTGMLQAAVWWFTRRWHRR